MPRLTSGDLGRLLDVLRDCYAIRDLDAFPHHVVMAIPALVLAAITTYNEADLRRGTVIDTGPGIDDALALVLALDSPELHVEALTTVAGNVRGQTPAALRRARP